MKATPGKTHKGATRTTSENPTKKAGRDDSFKKNQPKKGTQNTPSPNPTVRAGRASGAESNYGAHGGNRDTSAVRRLEDDGIAPA
jgi:hypothetical protein